jgi:hypothetical protein
LATGRPREPARPSALPLQPRCRAGGCSGPTARFQPMPRVTPSPPGVAPATAIGRGQPNDRKRSDEPLSQLPHCPGEDGRPHALGRAETARTPCANGRAKPRATRSERAPARPSADLRCHKRHGCACRGSPSGPCDQSASGRALVLGSALGRRAARLSSRCTCTRPFPCTASTPTCRPQAPGTAPSSHSGREAPVPLGDMLRTPPRRP